MFFERFREAVARLPAGLIRTGPPGDAQAMSAAEAQLETRLPDSYRSFLLSFDGADLFHEAIVLGGIGNAAPRRLLGLNADRQSHELMFGEAAGGNRFAFRADGRVLQIGLGSDERWIAGSDFSRWLDAVVAHERPLYGADGEFADAAFEPDGSEVLPRLALKQAEHALRFDPDAALWHHERGVALRRLDLGGKAKEAFARAAALDPENPWPLFDLGRTALALPSTAATRHSGAREALAAFETAARLESGVTGTRFWIWAARAALQAMLPEQLLACRREALARAPLLFQELTRARDAAVEDGDPDEIAEAEALLAALQAPAPTSRTHLPIVRDDRPAAISAARAVPARRTPRPGPRRPGPAGPPRSGGSRAGRRH